MLHEFFKKLQTELELKDVQTSDDDSSFAIAFDESIINITDSPPGFKLTCTINTLPIQQQEDFLTLMLRGNLFGQATNFAALGLDESGNKVVLQYYHPVKPTYKDFHNAVEDFINTVDYWQGQIKSHPSAL